jgi:hypothetical protein
MHPVLALLLLSALMFSTASQAVEFSSITFAEKTHTEGVTSECI